MPRLFLRISGHKLICALGAILMIGISALSWAQVGTGTIQGTITDTTGGVLPDAEVKIRNLDTNVTTTTLTNDQGLYRISSVPVGRYEVQASMEGFKTAVQTGVTVSVGSSPVVDLVLAVGEISETITIEAEPSLVETQTASVYNLVTPQQMRELPLNGRNYSQLIMLAPGVQPVPPNPGVAGTAFYGAQENYSIAGSRPEGQAFLLDNTDMSNFWNHAVGSSGTGYSLGVEAVAEFQLLTSTYGAEFGGDGAVMNAVTKSGTNTIHGSAYEYHRNSVLDARDYFNLNADGSPAEKPSYRRNQFGVSVGGPIIKDKLFFFGNYEGSRESLGMRVGTNVPMPYVAQGQLPCSAISPVPEGCPETPSGDPGSSTNPIVDVPDAVPNSMAIAALFPEAPANGIDRGGYTNFTSFGNLITRQDYALGRIDYNISNDDMLYGRYIYDRGRRVEPFAGGPIEGFPSQADSINQFFTMEEKHIFSPQMFNSLLFAFSRTNEYAQTTSELAAGNPLQFYTDRPAGLVNIGSVMTIGANVALPYYIVQNKFTVGDNFVWNKGSHTLKAGVQLVRVQTNLSAPAWLGGQYNFPTLQDFLQGNAQLFFGSYPGQTDATRDFREIDLAPYVQDEWKVTPKLTMNLGLRYEFATNGVGVRHPLNAIFDPPYGGFEPVTHVFRNNPNGKNFEPRVGLAYDPFKDHKTSIRAGFGIFFDRVAPRTYASGYYFAPPFANTSSFYLGFPPFDTPIPYPNSFPPPLNPPGSGPITLFAGVDYNIHAAPYMVQYNFTVQHEIPQGMVLSLGYVGSQGHHLFSQNDVNPYQCNTPGTEPGSTPTTDCYSVDSNFDPGSGSLPRINPNNSSMMMVLGNSYSYYNSLQVGLIRRMKDHVAGQVSYTWGKSLDNGSVTSGLEQFSFPRTTWYNVDYDYGRSSFDVRHNLVVNSLIEIPITGNPLVEGWQISQILSASSGMPVNILEGYDNSGVGAIIQSYRPDYSGAAECSPNRIVDLASSNPSAPGAIQWFDPMCYSGTVHGTLGNVPRNSLDAPGVLEWDVTLKKDTKVGEGKNVEFRAEFFNIINHPMFNAPAFSIFSSTDTRAPNAGQITSTSRRPRQIQFALKFTF